MFDEELVKEILSQMYKSCNTILKRIHPIQSANDFLGSDAGLEKLDSICMQLIALGESIKNLDKITNNVLLKKFPHFEWKKAKGMRDIISHHYFDLNSEIVFEVSKNEIPKLKKIIEDILANEFNQKINE